MYLMTQTTMRRDDSIVMMFTLMPKELPRDSDEGTEIAFQSGLVDGNGTSPDLVVSLEDIAGAVRIASFEIADQPIGMALRALTLERNLDEAVRQVAALVGNRCKEVHGQPVTIGAPQIL